MKSSISKEVDTARANTSQTNNEARLNYISDYKKQDVIKDTQPIYSSAADVCYLAHNDSGWTIDSHYQVCYFRYVDVFETDITNQQYLKMAMPDEDVSAIYDALKGSLKTCSDDRSELGSADMTEMGYTAADMTDNICTLPETINSNRVVAYALDTIVSAKTETGDKNKVTGKKNNVIIVADYAYYRKDLGCKPLTFFCDEPIETPIVGSMKAQK